MVVVAQLVRASVCGTEGRRFETDLPPIKKGIQEVESLFLCGFTNFQTLFLMIL